MSLLTAQNSDFGLQSFYRRYRPQVFGDVVGQEHVTHTLSNALKSDPPRVNHAYLFCGPRGTGKTTTARLVAKGLNCEQGPTATPCCKCDMCLRIARGSAMDVLEIDAASNTGVDKVRDVIIEKVNYAPAEGRYRVYIIDEVHQLSIHAFNALLKTLEEPPPHVVFILATTETHKVPGTILSRCQRFDFRPISPEHIIQRLKTVIKEEKLDVELTALGRIARAAEGSARDALSILEQAAAYSEGTVTEIEIEAVLGSVGHELLSEMTDALIRKDTRQAVLLLHRAVNQGKDIQQMFLDLGSHLRDLLILSLGCDSQDINVLPAEMVNKMKEQASLFNRRSLADIIDELCRAEREMRANSQHRLLAELTMFKCTQSREPVSVSEPARDEPKAVSILSAAEPSRERLLTKRIPSEPKVHVEAEVEASAPVASATPGVLPAGIDGLWTQVLAVARKQSVRLHAVLLDATPVNLSENALSLEFANQFHYDHIVENTANKDTVRQIVSGLIGKPIGIKCSLGSQTAKSTRSGVTRTASVSGGERTGGQPDAPDKDAAENGVSAADGVSAAMSLFDAKVVSERPSGQSS